MIFVVVFTIAIVVIVICVVIITEEGPINVVFENGSEVFWRDVSPFETLVLFILFAWLFILAIGILCVLLGETVGRLELSLFIMTGMRTSP